VFTAGQPFLIAVQAGASTSGFFSNPSLQQSSNGFMNMHRKAERFLLVGGAVFLGICLSFLFGSNALGDPGAARASASDDRAMPAVALPNPDAVDFTLWSPIRVKAYRASLALKTDPAIGVLTIPRLKLTVPVYDGSDDETLDRGAGRVVGSVMPGERGNLSIAGHRDGFFRVLKNIAAGDRIQVESRQGTYTYVVAGTRIVDRKDVRVLAGRQAATLTLITCYPFYFVGHAPRRFVVTATLKSHYSRSASRP
jgi:sortase A